LSIETAFDLIAVEAMELGVFDQDHLKHTFASETTVSELERLSDNWTKISSRLKEAVHKESKSEVLKALLDLSDLINRYASIASTRYTELVEQRPKLSSGTDQEQSRSIDMEPA